MTKIQMNTVEKAENTNGYPTFNNCAHTLVDLSHLKPGTAECMHTFSIKLPNNRHVTLCVMQPAPNESCVDIQFYENGERIKTKALGFANGTGKSITDMYLYTVVAEGDE